MGPFLKKTQSCCYRCRCRCRCRCCVVVVGVVVSLSCPCGVVVASSSSWRCRHCRLHRVIIVVATDVVVTVASFEVLSLSCRRVRKVLSPCCHVVFIVVIVVPSASSFSSSAWSRVVLWLRCRRRRRRGRCHRRRLLHPSLNLLLTRRLASLA
jgi:hypothetical protein